MLLQHSAREHEENAYTWEDNEICLPLLVKISSSSIWNKSMGAKIQLFGVPIGVSTSLQNIFLNNQVYAVWKLLVLWFWKPPGYYTGNIIGTHITSKNRAADIHPLLPFSSSIFICHNPDWTLKLLCWHWVLTHGSRRCREAAQLLGNTNTPIHWGWWIFFKEHFLFSVPEWIRAQMTQTSCFRDIIQGFMVTEVWFAWERICTQAWLSLTLRIG